MIRATLLLFTIFIFIGCSTQPTEQPMESADLASKVNVFLGIKQTEKYTGPAISENLPRIDTGWFDVREIYGATHPGATLPFGMVSSSVMGRLIYKTGFPTGYDADNFYGLTHFHSTGPGTIRWYYNYLMLTPVSGEKKLKKFKRKIVDEKASPGYYSLTLDDGHKAFTTVSDKVAYHRFTFPNDSEKHLILNLSNYLRAVDSARVIPNRFPESVEAEMISKTELAGKVMMDGFPIFFYMQLDSEPTASSFFESYQEVDGSKISVVENDKGVGVSFTFGDLPNNSLNTRIGFSFKSAEKAKATLNGTSEWSLETVKDEANAIWNEHLGFFEVKGDPAKIDLFYTSLYKAILKPADLSGENPFWDKENYWADLATSWDIYSTQIPFVNTFFPEKGVKIAQFYVDLYNQFGRYPPAYLMKRDFPWVFAKQASALGNFIIGDAIARDLEGIDLSEALKAMDGTLNNKRGKLFQEEVVLSPSPTHNQDYAYAAFCAYLTAEKQGEIELAKEYLRLSDKWRSVYDENGILGVYEEMHETELYPRQEEHWHFYEGNQWNYTYRIWQNMQGLIDLQGGRDSFLENLDWYYGLKPNDTEFQFQGLNNEVDYCSPYAYIYAGRPDRTQQVLRVAMEYRFSNTRGGLPGNDDAGAMTSWYVWNSMGLFPICGQPILMIGSPMLEEIKINKENPLTIKAMNNSKDNIYIESAILNGEPLNRAFIHFDEFKKGGELVLNMVDKPTSWGTEELPPSYPIQ